MSSPDVYRDARANDSGSDYYTAFGNSMGPGSLMDWKEERLDLTQPPQSFFVDALGDTDSSHLSASSVIQDQTLTHIGCQPTIVDRSDEYDNDIVLVGYPDAFAQNGTESLHGRQWMINADDERYQYSASARLDDTPQGWACSNNVPVPVKHFYNLPMDQQPWNPHRGPEFRQSTLPYHQTPLIQYGASSQGVSVPAPSQGDYSSRSNFMGTRTSYTSDVPMASNLEMPDSTMTIRPQLTSSNLAHVAQPASDHVLVTGSSNSQNVHGASDLATQQSGWQGRKGGRQRSYGQHLPNPYDTAYAGDTPSPAQSILSVTSPEEPETLLCLVNGCCTPFTGPYRRGNRGRHMRHKHTNVQDCVCTACGKEFKRTDARLKHIRKKHPGLHVPGPKARK